MSSGVLVMSPINSIFIRIRELFDWRGYRVTCSSKAGESFADRPLGSPTAFLEASTSTGINLHEGVVYLTKISIFS